MDTLQHDALRADLLGAWQQYGELHGVPAVQMAAIIEGVAAQQAEATSEAGYRQLIGAAGFTHVTNVLSIMGDALCPWIAR